MYRIVLKKKAKKFIDHLPVNEKRRVVAAIERLPEGEDIKRMKGCSGCGSAATASYTPSTTANLWSASSTRAAGDRSTTIIEKQRAPRGALCFCLPS